VILLAAASLFPSIQGCSLEAGSWSLGQQNATVANVLLGSGPAQHTHVSTIRACTGVLNKPTIIYD